MAQQVFHKFLLMLILLLTNCSAFKIKPRLFVIALPFIGIGLQCQSMVTTSLRPSHPGITITLNTHVFDDANKLYPKSFQLL